MNAHHFLANCLIAVTVVAVLSATLGVGTAGAAEAAPQTALKRNLSDYANADGSKPDGRHADRDDTIALQKALAAGPGVVSVGPGEYKWGDVTVPAGVTLVGAGSSTIVRSNGAKQIFNQNGVVSFSIRSIALDGGETGDWHARKDEGKNGIAITASRDFEIVDVRLRNFNGTGLLITYNAPRGPGHMGLGSLSGITAERNYTGIWFGVRAEYLNAADLTCNENIQGAVINAGNVKIVNSNFVNNQDGMVISDGDNGSHGIISSSMFNHNERYALLCQNVLNGMVIDGCAFFYGTLQLENSAGVNVTDGMISCDVKTIGEGAFVNRLAGNYVIPQGWKWALSAKTISKDNFSNQGAYEGR